MNYITTYLRKIISIVYYSTIHSYRWIVLFCAVILGRYYTDEHTVDEDEMTISLHGGAWSYHSTAGIVFRYLWESSSHTSYGVASSIVEILIIYYTNSHDVDEEMRAIILHGACWYDNIAVGVMIRYLFRSSSHTSVSVASSVIAKCSIYGWA